jgi:hypothetical protein
MSLEKAISSVVNAALANVHTAIPGMIDSFDGQKANVKPLIKRIMADGVTLPMPKLFNVPVAFMQSKDFSITFPIQKGDTGLLLFTERSIDVWLSKGGEVKPRDTRRFDLSDAVFYPGLVPFTQKPNSKDKEDFLVYYKDFKIKINKDGKLSIGKDGVELLDLMDKLLNALIQSTVATSIGPQMLSKVLDGTVTGIKTDLTKIRGIL